jgi:enamine deaminase RidA (YjgF/YER057c/UK114 family)
MAEPFVQGERIREYFHTLSADPGDPLGSVLSRVDDIVSGRSGHQVLEVRVFGSSPVFDSVAEGLRAFPEAEEWPISIFDGSPAGGEGLAGMQIHTVTGTPVETVRLEGEVVGRAFRDGGARYLVLGGLGPGDLDLDPVEQTARAILRMETALHDQGMAIQDLVRTWFFLDRILEWYGAFNETRTRMYQDRGLFARYVPASTGIGAKNHQRGALLLSALALRAECREAYVREIASPLQCPAGKYGSSFARAAELVRPGSRRVLVSGTASIDLQGLTVHRGDVEAQIKLTTRVVGAILASRGMGFGDVVRGNAYFKEEDHARALGPQLPRFGLPSSRLLVSQNTVCREDLLFELEVDAAG